MSGASVPAVLAGCSVGLAVASVAVRVDRRVAERLTALAGDRGRPDRRPSLLSALGASGLGGRLQPDRSLRALMEGRSGSWSPVELAGARLLVLLVGVGFGVAVGALWQPAGLAALCALPVAVRLPAMVLRRRLAAERAEIEAGALELVEILLAAIEAGLPPSTAVERAAGLLHGPLGREIDRVGREIALGLDWRTALQQSAVRTQSDSLGTLSSTLARAHRLGTSPRMALRALATELRAERRARAEERARRAPVKMLFPLVLLILPAFLLLTVGPVLLSTVRSLH
jgi:tight adherence protein C